MMCMHGAGGLNKLCIKNYIWNLEYIVHTWLYETWKRVLKTIIMTFDQISRALETEKYIQEVVLLGWPIAPLYMSDRLEQRPYIYID